MDLEFVEITSDRLKLVPISFDFTGQVFQEFSPEVTNYMHPKPPEKVEDTKQFIQNSLDRLKTGENLQLVVLDKQNGDFLGCAGLHSVLTRTPELGIWLKTSAWGKGYGREAIAALKSWTDKNVSYDYIKYPVDKRNIPSRKIPELLGGVISKEYSEISESGKQLELIEYRIYPKP